MLQRQLFFGLGALALAIFTSASNGLAQTTREQRFFDTAVTTAIEVVVEVVDEQGATPADLGPDDFELLEGGEPRAIVAVEPAFGVEGEALAGPSSSVLPRPQNWRISLYVDVPLCDPRALQETAAILGEQVQLMTMLGEVEVVVADPRPMQLLAPTRDAAKVRKALEKLGKRLKARQEIVTLRREFLRKLEDSDIERLLPSGEGGRRAGSGTGSGRISDRTGRTGGSTQSQPNQLARANRQRMLVRASAQQEHQLLARQRLFLTDWLAVAPAGEWRALMLVSDGYDLRPADFYLDVIEDSRLISELGNELESLASGSEAEQLAEQLAAESWTVVNLSLGNLDAASSLSASEGGSGRYRSFFGDFRSSTQPSSGRYFKDPLGPLLLASEMTAGYTVADPSALSGSLERLGRRVRLVYQVARRPDGVSRPIEVRPVRPGLTVRAPRLAASAPPDRIIAARARGLLLGEGAVGDLDVDLELERGEAAGQATLRADVALDALESVRSTLTRAALRVTVAIVLPDGRISISQQTAHDQDLSRLASWRYSAPMAYPEGSPQVAVVVDELGTGAWGGASAALP